MRIIFILLLIVVAIGLLRMLVGDVIKAVGRSLKSNEEKQADGASPDGEEAGARRFVRDPESGAYIDETSALRVTIDGQDLFFESEKTRDAYLRKQDRT